MTVRAGGKLVNDRRRIARIILAGRVEEDVTMRGRWPSLVDWPLEFHRPDEESRHVATVGVFAANADLTNASEIVDIVLFYLGTGEVADSAFKYDACELVAGYGLRCPQWRKRAAAIATQPQMHAHSGRPLLERSKSLRNLLLCSERSEH